MLSNVCSFSIQIGIHDKHTFFCGRITSTLQQSNCPLLWILELPLLLQHWHCHSADTRLVCLCFFHNVWKNGRFICLLSVRCQLARITFDHDFAYDLAFRVLPVSCHIQRESEVPSCCWSCVHRIYPSINCSNRRLFPSRQHIWCSAVWVCWLVRIWWLWCGDTATNRYFSQWGRVVSISVTHREHVRECFIILKQQCVLYDLFDELDQVAMDKLLDLKASQVQLAKDGLNLLTFSDIDMSPQSFSDRLLHFLQGLRLIPRDSL